MATMAYKNLSEKHMNTTTLDTLPDLIGLGGKLRAGKGAVAEHLEKSYGYVTMGMSDPLNVALLALNPFIPWKLADIESERGDGFIRYQELHDAVGYVEAKKNPEVRRLLQALGTEVGRDMIGTNTWVDIAERTILDHWANGKRVVIDGIRFPNELELLDKLGGMKLWIARPDADRLEGTTAPQTGVQGLTGHASENGVTAEEFDYVVENTGTLEELYATIDRGLALDSLTD